jgi:hypothetical protein
MENNVICHGASIWCCNLSVAKEKVRAKYTAKDKSSFSPSSFLQGYSTKATGPHILLCLKETNKIKIEVWFIVLMKTSSNITGFFIHQKLVRACSLSSLYMGDSNFNHVPMNSPSVPRLARMHQKTITLHSHCKTGVVVW